MHETCEMTTSILVIGDPHIRTNEVAFTDRMLHEIAEIASIRRPHAIVVLGDTLDTNNSIDSNPLTRAVNWLRKLQDIAPLILLIGNHDIKHNEYRIDKAESPEHPFVALKWWNNTHVIDKPQIVNVNGCSFLACPYVPDGQYHDAVGDMIHIPVTAYLSHNSFYGVRYRMTDKPSETGDVWPAHRRLMICGHIHEYQWVAHNLVFVGTPGQQDFGANVDKGITIFTFDGDEYTHERITLKSIPVRRMITFELDEMGKILELIEEVKEWNKHSVLHLTKITIRGPASQLRVAQKSPWYITLKSLHGISMNPTPTEAVVEDAVQSTIDRLSTRVDEAVTSPEDRNFLSLLGDYFRGDDVILELLKEIA